MTAVPHTAAIRANAGRHTQQPLRGSQREYTRRRRPAPIADYLPLPRLWRAAVQGLLPPHRFTHDEGFKRECILRCIKFKVTRIYDEQFA